MRKTKTGLRRRPGLGGKFALLLCLVITVNILKAQQNKQVNNPQTVFQASDGTISLHASTGHASGTEIGYMQEWKAFGWFRSDCKVEWSVIVTKAGRYEVLLEWSVSDEEAGKRFLLQASRHSLKGNVLTTGSWEIFKKEPIGYIDLRAGKQQITFKPQNNFGAGALLDLREISLIPVKTITSNRDL